MNGHPAAPAGVAIERASLDDAEQLIHVQDLAFREDFERYGHCPSYREPAGALREMIRSAIVYKVTAGGRIIGDAIVRKAADGSYYLRTIAIIPAYQGRGIGSHVLSIIEQDNPGGAYWSLITPKGTARNLRFYERHGYRKRGERRHSDRLTLVEYRKDLRSAGPR
jgi:ribosomal protein S18 acetylase RimI-like enzyme